MEKYNLYGIMLLAVLSTALFSSMFPSAMSTLTQVDTVKTMGIDGPFSEGTDATTSYSFQLEGFSKGNSGNYIVLSFKDLDGRISVPGYPALPYDVQVVEAPGQCVIEEISVSSSSLSYKIESLTKKVLPAPKPLFYFPIEGQTLVYEENEDVYARSKYFPGRLVEYTVGYGSGGKTIITMHLYPLQYNPITSTLAIFDSFKVLVKYHVEQYSDPSEKMVIITTSASSEAVWPLAEFYNRTIGLSTEVKTTDWIYSSYPAAENITEYSGFYSPVQLNPYYYTLADKYDWILALKIISYLNDTKPTHVLLVGNSVEVPPSFYYQSSFMSQLSEFEGWIPTDYFYGSADYDLIPERSVGRIPFSDNATVQKVVDKILSWYSATWPSHPDWMRNLVMAGGYPFLLTYMFGESALSTVTRQGYTQMFNTTLLMRTDGNYHRDGVQSILRNGEAGWLLLLCHGSGTELGDYLFADGGLYAETLAGASELLEYPSNPNLPVVTSVACLNGAWDEGLLPPEFVPPSFGESLLMSNASGMAYIGSARSAFEIGVYFSLDEGLLDAEFYGVTLMHTMLLKAYNSFMGARANVSLGEVFAEGVKDYVNTIIPLFGQEAMDLVYANIFMLNLMGDPGLKLPVYDSPFSGEQISDANALDPDSMISSTYITQLGGLTNGTIPLYRPLRNATIRVIGTGENVDAKIVQTYFSGPYLYGYKTAAVAQESLVFGEANVTITTNKTLSGLLLFKVKVKGVEARFYITSAGLTAQPAEVAPSSTINVEGFGLNLIPADQAVLTIGGWAVTSIFTPFDGFVEWSFAAPFFDPGIYTVSVSFSSYLPPPPELSALFRTNVTILSFLERPGLEVRVTGGTQYEPDDTVVVRIATVLNGELTDANLTVNLIKPAQVVPLTHQRVAEGEYKLEFPAPSTPATYFVSVKAEIFYTLPAFNATAYNIHAFTVTLSLEELKALIQAGNNELNASLMQLSDRVVEIRTVLGTIEGYIEGINGTTAVLVSEVGNIALTLSEIQQLMNDAKGEVIAEINTQFGSLNFTLDQLNGKIVQVSDRTVEIRSVLGVIEGNVTNINNGIATIQTAVGEIQVGTNIITQQQLPSTFAAVIVVIVMVAVLITVIVKKFKPSR